MNKLNKKQKIIIIIIFIIIVTAIVYCIYANEKKELIPYDEELENINNNEMQIEEENKQLNEENTFGIIGATICDNFDVKYNGIGKSILSKLK